MLLLDYAYKFCHRKLFLVTLVTVLFVLYTFKTLQCSLKADRTIIVDDSFNVTLLKNKYVIVGKGERQKLIESNQRTNTTTQSPNDNDLETYGNNKYLLVDEEGSKPERRLPQALVIGVKKCGTRALLEFLRIHPDIRAAGSEIHFFDKHYCKGLDWYQHRMPPTLRGQLTMEKTPGYYVTREAPARVFKMNPLIKLLVVVRDPVTRAISDYTQAASKKQGGVADSREFERQVFVADTNIVDTGWGPVRLGLYSHYLKHWLYFFNISQILFVSGEQLIADPATPMAMVQDFLGIKRVITEKHFYFNATKGFPCLLKSERRAGPHCLGSTKGRSHPEIRPSVIQTLRNFYRPFNKKFYHMTGIDFGWP